jgi:hypothetical protein
MIALIAFPLTPPLIELQWGRIQLVHPFMQMSCIWGRHCQPIETAAREPWVLLINMGDTGQDGRAMQGAVPFLMSMHCVYAACRQS